MREATDEVDGQFQFIDRKITSEWIQLENKVALLKREVLVLEVRPKQELGSSSMRGCPIWPRQEKKGNKLALFFSVFCSVPVSRNQ